MNSDEMGSFLAVFLTKYYLSENNYSFSNKKLMKTALLSCFLFLTCLAFGQPTLTFTDYQSLYGYEINYEFGNFVDEGPTGANQVWDFSNVTFNPTTTGMFLDPAETEYGMNYPESDLAIVGGNVGSQQFTYYNFLSDGIYLVGGEFQGLTSQPYTNTRRDLSTPMNYEDSYQDSAYFESTTSGFTSLGASNYEIEVDGYGTLITPTATYNNVLRIHQTESTLITLDLGGTTVETEIYVDSYGWLIDEFPFPILLITESETNGQASSQSRLITGDALSVLNPDQKLHDLSIYPVPATDVVHIDLGENELTRATARIYDMKGALLKETIIQRNSGTFTIGVNELPSGFYSIQIVSDQGVGALQFTK